VQIAESAYQFCLRIRTKRVHRYATDRTDSGPHLLHIVIAALAESEVDFDLGRRVGVEHALEVVSDEFDYFLATNGQAGCGVLVVHEPIADALAE
jgi:hypothetical protein